MFEDQFRIKGYGPDVLHLVKEDELRTMGLSDGNVIRLQQNAPNWWNSSRSKRKRSESSEPVVAHTVIIPEPRTPPNKKVSFNKVFNNNEGASRCYGPRITPGRLPPNAGFTYEYYCEARARMCPLPDGYIPVLEDAEPEDNGW